MIEIFPGFVKDVSRFNTLLRHRDARNLMPGGAKTILRAFFFKRLRRV